MVAKSTIVLLILLVLCTAVFPADKTPYKFVFGGNSYSGTRNATVKWLADRYDAAIAGTGDWPGLHDSIYDACKAMGKEFWDGPYASSHEINLYERDDPGLQYNERLGNVREHWLYIYAKRYMDSIGVSPESLVVHIADDYVSITNAGDGQRAYSLTGLSLEKKRFTYQYWNNYSSDMMFYPAGYCWLANGYNINTRKAIAYAYRRYILEDSTLYGPGDHHWGAYFMDNQYRQGTSPRLSSYYTINSTSGGPTSGLDWIEQSGIGNDVAANARYYDGSTMLIDSTIAATLDSVCRARGLAPVHGFANVDKCWPSHLSVQIKYTNVALENPVDFTKAWPNGWQMWYDMADTMAAHPERYVAWMFLGDFLCSNNPADWKYDSSRIYMTHYAFFLQVRDTNALMGPCRFNDTTRWRAIYELNLGEPDGPAYEISSVGSGYTKIAVMRRDYDNGRIAALVRTAHSTADYVSDSVAVNLHQPYYEISDDADTSDMPDSIFYMKPYSGRILMSADSCRIPPSIPIPALPASGASVGTSPTLCVFSSSHGDCPDPVTYQFEIAADAGFAGIIRQSGWISEGVGTTCFTTSAPLDSGRRFWWHSRANNGTVISRWSTAYNFTTPNTPPPEPTGNSPADQGTIETRYPTLTVNNVTDPDGTPVVYYFEVSKSADFSSFAAHSGPVNAGTGMTSWQVSAALENGSLYYWRARAYDQIAFGGWMTTWSFTVSVTIANEPPTAPVAYWPPDGAVVTSLPLTLTWYNSTDADGDQLTYQIEFADSSGAVIFDQATGIPQGPGATTSYSPQFTPVNGVWYSWRGRAFDGIDVSEWMPVAGLHIDTLYAVNQPPQPPPLVSPGDFDTLVTLEVTLISAHAFDPEADPLTYEFAVYDDEALTNLIDSVSGLVAGGTGNISWSIAAPLASGGQYFWSCRAHDGANPSAWAPSRTFWAFDFSVDADQAPPTNFYPADGSMINMARPNLEVLNAKSSQEDNQYFFEVSEDASFINRIYSGPVPENESGRTVWEVSTPLREHRTYFWRSRINNSPYSAVSTFQVAADVFIAPNPFRPDAGHREVTVYNMSAEGTLTITTIANEVVRIIEGNSSGEVLWDVCGGDGDMLASDVYLCYYKDGDKINRFKFAVIR